ncbi:MAG: glycosyltransferase, partial [Anaerolineae bacterium]|nr:glycosyltransferase [Anaerolineae bacterium]
PTYNGAKYLQETIESILSQTFTDYELIIIDDHSEDDTVKIVHSFKDQRIKLIENPNRLGLVGNWNKCLEEAKEEYICLFHQDDVMMPDNLTRKIDILKNNKSVGMVHSNVYQIGPDGSILSKWWYFKPAPNEDIVQPGSAIFNKLLWGVNTVCCPSVVLKRECYEKLGGFDYQLPFTADWEMWLRIALFYDIAYLPQGLIKYRRHDSNETHKYLGVKELKHAHRAKIRVLEKYPENVPSNEATSQKVSQWYKKQALGRAINYYKQKNLKEAKTYLAYAQELNEIVSKTSFPKDQTLDLLLETIEIAERQNPEQNAITYDSHQIPVPELSLIYQPIQLQMRYNLSAEEMAKHIPLQRIIQTILFKVGNLPKLGWLYHFRSFGKKFLGGK